MTKLFSPINIKALELRNRVVMPPMANNLATEDGAVTEELVEHYRKRAQAEIGLVFVEHSYVRLDGRFTLKQTGIYSDEMTAGLKRLTEEIKNCGAAVGIQLAHAGARADVELLEERQPIGSSAVEVPRSQAVPREMSVVEIQELIEDYIAAAQRAVQAGFEVIEIHGAHGYLLNQFYSPLTNQRKDRYGGNRLNRLRLALEIIEAVRGVIGEERVLAFRLGADDRTEGGLTLEDGVWAAQQLDDAGIDLIDLSGGFCGYLKHSIDVFFDYLAEAVKPRVKAPVLVTGGIKDAAVAERIVREGIADLVGIGRSLLKDPLWAAKAKEELF